MQLPIKKCSRRDVVLVWGFALVFFMLFSYLIPKQVDDWYFLNVYREAPQNGGLLAAIHAFSSYLNGRICGNGLLLLTSGSEWLRAITKTAAYAVLLFGMGRLSGLNRYGGTGWAAAFLSLMLLPIGLLRETYAWDPGFMNYVPPAALLLLYWMLTAPLFSNQRIHDTVLKTALCFLLGVSVQLFAENILFCVLLLSAGMVIWHILCTRRLSFLTVAFFAGALTGAVLMLRSPVYSAIAQSSDGYRVIPNSFGMLLYVLKLNYPAFSYYSLEHASLLQVLVSLSALVLLARDEAASDTPKHARLRRALTVLLTVLPVYFFMMSLSFDTVSNRSQSFLALTQFFGSFYAAMAFDLLLYLLYVAAVACVLILFNRNATKRNLALAAMASALAVSAPMLLVQPSSYRCFYTPYVLWALVSLLLIDEALNRFTRLPRDVRICYQRMAKTAVYSVAGTLCAILLMLYAACPRIERLRVKHIEQEMRRHAVEIVLPEYGCTQFLHLPDEAIGMYYHYVEWTDITFRFLPYDEWNAVIAPPVPKA